jgi:RNA polymerase sigma factor (sigma-70 family)
MPDMNDAQEKRTDNPEPSEKLQDNYWGDLSFFLHLPPIAPKEEIARHKEPIQALSLKNRNDFQVYINRYYGTACRIALTLVGKELARDIVQQVVLELWRRGAPLSSPTPFFRRVTQRCIDHWRRVSRHPISPFPSTSLEEEEDPSDPFEFLSTTASPITTSQQSSGPLEHLVSTEQHDVVLNAVLALPNPNHRLCILLHYFAGLKLEEVAATMGTNNNNVKSWHSRALKKLRQMPILRDYMRDADSDQ